MNRPLATVSVDVDPVDLHLLGYGVRGLEPDPLVYTAALPRLMEAFARAGVHATLFVVGRDAGRHAASLAALAAAGHEVASHSHTHPMALARLPRERVLAELVDSRAALSRAAGADTIGFRAPNFDLDRRSVPLLAAAGYRYDASGYPSLFLMAARALLTLKSGDPAGVMRLRATPFTWNRRPHRWRAGGHEVVEFPTAVSPVLRLPIYHTTRYLMSEAGFAAHLDGFVRRGEAMCYPLHAVDALGLAEDRVHPRLAPHPGMDFPLETKLRLLDRTLAEIARRFDTVTYREHLARLEAPA